MGLLSVGTPLPWAEAKQHADHVRKHGIAQFLHVWHKLKLRRRDQLLWGDEIEYVVVKYNNENRTVQVTNRAHDVLMQLEEIEKKAIECGDKISWSFKPEYGRYMLEGTPAGPYGATLEHLLDVETNMAARRKFASQLLQDDEGLLSVTNFPLLGVNSSIPFIYPGAAPTPLDGASKSLFIPDTAINPHPRFRTLTANIRQRRESKVCINVPIFKDSKTPSPFREKLPASVSELSREQLRSIRNETLSSSQLDLSDVGVHGLENEENPVFLDSVVPDAKPDNIYMDCMCFGMGCCCLQVTFQACSVEEARKLYDQLTPLTPILMALSAGSPIFRGYLADVDCRWNVISASVDDRTKEERGVEPLSKSRFQIPKSRYASISTYLSPGPNYSGGCPSDPDIFSPDVSSLPPAVPTHFEDKYNDIPLIYDKAIYKELIDNGVDHLLARHYAHLYIRDPLVVFTEKLNLDDTVSSDHFENIQSTNWQTMRFKPPPPMSPIGWRVEFRSMEVQWTDFENAAYSIFIVLLTRTILSFDLNLYMPLSKVDENMEKGQKRDAVLSESFQFRKNIFGNLSRLPSNFLAGQAPKGVHEETETDYMGSFTVDELINGKENIFPGFVPLVRAYLAAHPTVSLATRRALDAYLDLISKRASGTLPTAARWMRNYAMQHPDYKKDSSITPGIAYELMKRIQEFGSREGRIPGFTI